MKTAICILLVAGASSSVALAQNGTPTPAPYESANNVQEFTAGQYTGPRIRVSNRRLGDERDSRAAAGNDVRVSMPGQMLVVSGGPVVRADRAIAVPDNTLGPGLSLQQQNDLVNAQIRQAEAAAFYDERVAERAIPDVRWGFVSPGGHFRRAGAFDGFGHRFSNGRVFENDADRAERIERINRIQMRDVRDRDRDGDIDRDDRRMRDQDQRRQPETAPGRDGRQGKSNVTPDNQLGAQARRNFAVAATPKVTEVQSARDQAVRQFGQTATPPVNQIEKDRSEAFLKAQREQQPVK